MVVCLSVHEAHKLLLFRRGFDVHQLSSEEVEGLALEAGKVVSDVVPQLSETDRWKNMHCPNHFPLSIGEQLNYRHGNLGLLGGQWTRFDQFGLCLFVGGHP